MRTAGRSRIFDVLEPRFDVVVKDKETRGRLKADNAAGYRPVFSYANYLQVDGGVLLSQFGDEETDAAALETVRKAFLREKFDGECAGRHAWRRYTLRLAGGSSCLR